MPQFKNMTTQSLAVKLQDGSRDTVKAGETKDVALADNRANAALLHAGALQEVKGRDKPASRSAPPAPASAPSGQNSKT